MKALLHKSYSHRVAAGDSLATFPLLATSESPPDAVQAVVDCIQAYGWRVFQAILGATDIETRGRLLAVLVSGLPQGLQEEFRGVAGDAGA